MTVNKCLSAAMLGGILAVNILYHLGNPAEYMVLGVLNAALVAVTACMAGTRLAAMMAMAMALTVNFWIMEPVLQFSVPTIPEYLMLAANTILAIAVPHFRQFDVNVPTAVAPPAPIERLKGCAAPIRSTHSKFAIQLCAQLPDGATDARLVLLAMQDVVDNYFDREKVQGDASAQSNVLPFSH